ncbi:MAG: DUF2442 domain-containing protein [Pirellulales bacterium]
MTMNPRVKSVVATDDYRLILTFTNGEVGTFDCSHLLEYGVFREFQNVGYFLSATVVDGTVAWPNGQDICPDTLYEDSIRHSPQNTDQSGQPEPPITRVMKS